MAKKSLTAQFFEAVDKGKGDVEKVAALIDRGVDVNERNAADLDAKLRGHPGMTALESALWCTPTNPKLISLLVNKGADVNLPGSYIFTPAQIATNHAWLSPNNFKAFKIIVSAGARLHATSDNRYEPALHLAIMNWIMVAGVRAAGEGSITGDLARAMKAIDFLIRHGADVNEPDAKGATPLHAAVTCGFGNPNAYTITPSNLKTLVEFLLDKRADPTVKDSAGKTPRDYLRPWIGAELRPVDTLLYEAERSKLKPHPDDQGQRELGAKKHPQSIRLTAKTAKLQA